MYFDPKIINKWWHLDMISMSFLVEVPMLKWRRHFNVIQIYILDQKLMSFRYWVPTPFRRLNDIILPTGRPRVMAKFKFSWFKWYWEPWFYILWVEYCILGISYTFAVYYAALCMIVLNNWTIYLIIPFILFGHIKH